MKKLGAALLISNLMLPGCDSPTEAPSPRTEKAPSTPFDTQINALEKAKGVEGQLQQDAEDRAKQMEQATQ